MTSIYNNNKDSGYCQQQQQTPQTQQTQSKIPIRYIETLKDKLKGTISSIWKYIEVKNTSTNETQIKKMPITSIRGNAVYSYKRNKAINAMTDKLKEQVTIETGLTDDYILTNTLFLTCTLRYDVSNYQSLEHTWELFRDNSSTFSTALKRIGKKEQQGLLTELHVIEYVQSFEAHLSSACHSHYVLLLKNPVVCKKQVDEQGKTRYVPSENVKSILYTKYEHIFGSSFTSYDCFNVQGCYAIEGLGGYISKELTKQHGNIEPILRKVDKDLNETEPLTNNEIKTLYLHYFTHIFKMDMIRTSRGLSCVVTSKEEKEDEQALDFNKELNDKNQTDLVELGSIILSNKTLYLYLKRKEITPYSGFLQEGKEKQVISELIAAKRESEERIMTMIKQALG